MLTAKDVRDVLDRDLIIGSDTKTRTKLVYNPMTQLYKLITPEGTKEVPDRFSQVVALLREFNEIVFPNEICPF